MGPVLVGPLEFSSQGSLVEKSLRILRGQGQSDTGSMGLHMTWTGDTLVKSAGDRGDLAHRIQQKTQSPGRPGFYVAWRWPASRNGTARGTPATSFFFFLTREKGVKLHSRNRGGPVWLGRLLDGLEMTLRCTEPGLMLPWAPERSSHWQPIRAQSSSAAGMSLAP